MNPKFRRLGLLSICVFLLLPSAGVSVGTAPAPEGGGVDPPIVDPGVRRDWTGAGDGVSWTDPANWLPAGVPGAGDDVYIHVAFPDTINAPAPFFNVAVTLEDRARVRSLTIGSETGDATLAIEQDTLTAEMGGSNTGDIMIGPGAAFEVLDGGIFTNGPEGEVRLVGGNLAGGGTFVNEGLLVKTDPAGIARAVSTVSMGMVNIQDDPADGAIVVGEGVLVFEAPVENSGTVSANSSSSMFLDPADGPLTEGGFFRNSGLVLLEDGSSIVFADGALFANLAGGELRLLGGDLLGDGALDNIGLVNKIDPEGVFTSTVSVISVSFDNRNDDPADGALTVGEGVLSIEDEFSNSGTVTVNSGSSALFDPADGPFVVTEITNNGQIIVEDGATLGVVDAGLVFANGPTGVMEFQGGDLVGDGRLVNNGLIKKTEAFPFRTSSRSGFNMVVENRQDDPGDGAIIVGEGILAIQDSLLNRSDVTVDSGATLEVDPDTTALTGGPGLLVNRGFVDVAAGANLLNRSAVFIGIQGVVNLQGEATVDPGAIWYQRGATLVGPGAALHIENDGRSAGTFENRGLLALGESAVVDNRGDFLHRENGTIAGNGMVDNSAGQFLASGIFRPGLPVGRLTFVGDLALQPVSEVWVQIAGNAAGTEYDQLYVEGQVTFGGALQVALLGFTPEIADRFDVIAGMNGIGKTFTSLDCFGGLDVPGGLFLQPLEETNALVLVTVDSVTTNGSPVAAFDLASTDTGVPVVIEALLNDVDPDGDQLRIVGVATGLTTGFVEIDDGDSSITYTPADGFAGVDGFAYIVTDCEGGADSSLVAVFVSSDPRVWNVPGDAPTIQAGIDSAFPGDTVVVACGVYDESDVTMKSGVHLRSEERLAGCVTIDAGGLGRGLICDGVDPGTLIEGLTVAGGAASNGGGLVCVNGAGPEFRRVAFAGNASTGNGGGVLVDGSSHPVFRQCTFSGNRAGGNGGGLYVQGGALVDRGILRGNGGTSGTDAYVAAFGVLAFLDAAVDSNGLAGLGSIPIGGAVIYADPLFCGALPPGDAPTSAGDYRIDYDSPCFFTPPDDLVGAYGVGCWGHLSIEGEWFGEGDFPDTLSTGVAAAEGEAGARAFFHVFPNPARDGLTIAWARPAAAEGRIVVYDVSGRKVKEYDIAAPTGTIRWDGRNGAGRMVAPGVYFLRLEMGKSVDTRRVTLVR
ncbi:MAG: Ig-like domain-containing protein [Candidatus Eisenbacteria bacterium]